MKKKLFLMLAALVVFSFAGCGSESAEDTTAATVDELPTDEELSEELVGEDAIEEPSPEDLSGETVEEQEIIEKVMEDYESKDGWKCQYDPALIACNENGSTVGFVFTGDCAGTSMIEISFIDGKKPQDVLDEKTKDWDKEKTNITESNFGGEDDLKSITAMLMSSDDKAGSGLHEYYTVIELNGGTLLFDNIWHEDDDEERAMYVSDTLAEVMDTFVLTDK